MCKVCFGVVYVRGVCCMCVAHMWNICIVSVRCFWCGLCVSGMYDNCEGGVSVM